MYNGHKNWNHWNVSLWLFNDEHYYQILKDKVRRCSNLNDAAVWIRESIESETTPDGAPWSKTAIRAALVGIRA